MNIAFSYTKKVSIILIFLLFLFSGAIASNCYQTSPQFNRLKEDYYDIAAVKDITRQDKEKIKNFYQGISGRWKGEINLLECAGTEKEPSVVSRKGRVIAEIRQESEGVLIIEGDVDYTTEKSSSSRKIKTLGWDSIFTIDQITKEQLEFTEKFRKGIYGGGTPLVEHVFRITRQSGNRLDIIQITYYNGILSIEERWTLKK